MNAAERAGPDEDPVMIRPQARIGDYRVDFLISQGDTELIVECDGHDFHERTQEQAASDRSRDRYLQACNYVVFRFTGQEIFRDVEGCAKEVCEFIDKRAKEPVTPRAMTDAPALLTIHPFPSRSRA
jgi:very-short-patch-repair endonuclease